MSRNIRATLLSAVLTVALVHPATAQSEQPATQITSDDGLVTLAIPAGAIPPGSDVRMTHLVSTEPPPELLDMGLAEIPNLYVIEPAGVTFDPPARFTRLLPMASLDRTPPEPHVVALLALRDAEGSWTWASDPAFRVDGPAEMIEVSGDIHGAGSVVTVGAGLVYSDIADTHLVDVGHGQEVQSGFDVPDFLGAIYRGEGHGAAVTGISTASADAVIADMGDVELTDDDGDLTLRQTIGCLTAGRTDTGLDFIVKGIGDDTYMTEALDLPATAVHISIVGSIECLE